MNFREVNEDDILKEWLEYREETLLCQLSDEDYKHSLNFVRRFCVMFLLIISSLFSPNLINYMMILWSILIIGARNIIGMGL